MLAWIVALFAIHYLHAPATGYLEPYVGTSSGASVSAFVLLLFVPFGLIKLIAATIGEASRASLLGPIDRVIGLGFGAIKGMIIAVLAFAVLVLAYDTVWGIGGRPTWITQARSYPFVNASSEALVTVIAERRREAAEEEARKLGKK